MESFSHGTESTIVQGNLGHDSFTRFSRNQMRLSNNSSAFWVLAAEHHLSTLPWSGTCGSHASTTKLSHARRSRKATKAESLLRRAGPHDGRATSKRATVTRSHSSAKMALTETTHIGMRSSLHPTGRAWAHSSHTATHTLHAHLLSKLLSERDVLHKSVNLLRFII